MPNFAIHKRRAWEFSSAMAKYAIIAAVILILFNNTTNWKWVIWPILVIWFLSFIGVLIPDIDHHASVPRRWFDRTSRFILPGVVVLGLSYLSKSEVTHGRPEELVKITIVVTISICLVLFIYTPKINKAFIPKHRGLFHNEYFWIVIGAGIAGISYLLIQRSSAFSPGLTATLSLSFGVVLIMGAHQHLEQDGLLDDDYSPGPVVETESVIRREINEFLLYTIYRIETSAIGTVAGIIGEAVSMSFNHLFSAISESIVDRSFRSFRKRLSVRDIIIIFITIIAIFIFIYILYRFWRWLQSPSSTENSEPIELSDTIRVFDGNNGCLKLTYESIILNRERWQNRHNQYEIKEIPLNTIDEIYVKQPGYILSGYIFISEGDDSKPKSSVFAYRAPNTIKVKDDRRLDGWVREAERMRRWQESLHSTVEEVDYLTARSE